MSLVRNLRPDRNFTGLMIPLSMLLLFGFATIFFGLPGGLRTMTGLMYTFGLFYLYTFLRTGSAGQLVPALEGAVLGTLLLMFEPNFGLNKLERTEFRAAFSSSVIFFGILIVVLALTRRLKWRGREVFELAGESVEETGNGYTSRPRPVGKVEYSPQQLRSFARFCARNLIALPYISAKNITLVPVKMGDEFGRLLGLSGDYRHATWINFDSNGEVSVHISQKDYLDYRESLAFDKLCASLGQVVIDFCDLHARGEGVRVIDRMDDLGLGIFS